MKSRKIGGIILTILLFIAAIITIVPFVWMFISSFAPNSEIVKVTGGLFPKPSTIDNYVSIQEKFNFFAIVRKLADRSSTENRYCNLHKCGAWLRVL